MTDHFGWSWIVTYQKYGFLPCTIKAACLSNTIMEKPKGYSEETLDEIVVPMENCTDKEKPDIILILNETFYDLSMVTDIETDVPYMENITFMENAIKGYAVNPAGGTNPSEYELLTSNSMKPMHGIIPFNVIDMTGANSIVSHLQQLGYHTIGAHCNPPTNYNRGKAYADMGFDQIYFESEFTDITYYGNRTTYATDECLYRNVISWLDANDGAPQFVYLLTIQNHGGWEMNEQEMDTVYALNDYGKYDEQIDEYLSCIRMSDQAFKGFTDNLKEMDRKVIVCMVGDHGPTLTGRIMDNPEKDYSVLQRTSVPFVIWANYDIEDLAGIDQEKISMNYLVPSLLDIANVNLSPYYQYLLSLKDEVPILTSFSGYYDKDGNVYTYCEDSVYTDMIKKYFYMEYNNLQDDRKQNLFDPY